MNIDELLNYQVTLDHLCSMFHQLLVCRSSRRSPRFRRRVHQQTGEQPTHQRWPAIRNAQNGRSMICQRRRTPHQ